MDLLRQPGQAPQHLGYLVNLSETGAFVESASPPPTGTCLSLVLNLPTGSGQRVTCRGEVVWTRLSRTVDALQPGMGIRFIAVIGNESRLLLKSFCRTVNALAC